MNWKIVTCIAVPLLLVFLLSVLIGLATRPDESPVIDVSATEPTEPTEVHPEPATVEEYTDEVVEEARFFLVALDDPPNLPSLGKDTMSAERWKEFTTTGASIGVFNEDSRSGTPERVIFSCYDDGSPRSIVTQVRPAAIGVESDEKWIAFGVHHVWLPGGYYLRCYFEGERPIGVWVLYESPENGIAEEDALAEIDQREGQPALTIFDEDGTGSRTLHFDPEIDDWCDRDGGSRESLVIGLACAATASGLLAAEGAAMIE